jgi:hypothetical protein
MAMDLIEQLRRLLKGQPLAKGCDWTDILKALEEANKRARQGDEECQRMLLEFLDQQWSVPLKKDSRVPSIMPPEEMLLRQALRYVMEGPALRDADKARLTENLRRIVSTAVSPALSQSAQEYLSRLTLPGKA